MSAVALQRPRPVIVPAPREESRVGARPRSSGRTLLLAALTLLVLSAAVFGAVALNALAADAAVEARRLERQVAAAEQHYGDLVFAVSAKENPARIRMLALELGLVPSTIARHLELERSIPADGARTVAGDRARVPDPLKPVLTQDR